MSRTIPLIVAHRGASADAPENTLPALALSWEQGADGFECDVQMTADGEVVCFHDADTQRVTGVKCVVKDTSLRELRELDAGAWFGPEFAGVRIPTLSEVFAAVLPGKRILIEVKCGPEILAKLIQELDGSDVTVEQVTVISFNAKVIAGLKAQRPEIEACWIANMKVGWRGQLKPSVKTVLHQLKKLHADGLSCCAYPALDTAYVSAIRAAGYGFHVWTVDELRLARQFVALGVDSITSNRPAALRQGLS